VTAITILCDQLTARCDLYHRQHGHPSL